MKKVFSKIMAIMCIVAMTLTCFSGIVSADNDILFDMKSLGIVNGVNVEGRLDSNITRGEFAQLVVNMMGQQEVAMSLSMDKNFTDVSNSPYAGAINLLYKQGIVSGTGDGTFMPDRNVRYTEACKMLVTALGYNVIVADSSLDAYTYTAGTVGITDNVNSGNEYITIKDMLIMIDNCLDIGKMVPMYYNNNIAPSYEINNADTFRRDLTKNNPEGFVKMRGIVTADVSTYLYDFNAALRDTQLEIAGKVFNYNGVAPLGYVGVEVDFYVSTTADGTYGTITSLKATDKNTVTEIDGSDVASFDNNEIKYYTSIESSKTQLVETDLSTIWIYNNDIYDGFSLSLVNLDGNCNIRTIDNDDDEVAEVVFVYEYTDCVVDSANEETSTVTLKQGYLYKNEKNITFDVEETKAFVEYYDENGKKADFSIIKEGSVLSIAKSADGLNIRVVVSNKGGQSLLEAKDGEYIVFDDVEYFAGNCETKDMKIGRNYAYKLNYKNHVVYIDELISESDYAYVYSIQNKGLSGVRVRLITPSKISTKTMQGDYNEETNAETSMKNLYLKNENIFVYNVAPTFTYEYWVTDANGDRYLESERLKTTESNLNKVLKQPVQYVLNADNEIIKFTMAYPSNVGSNPYYNSAENVFAQTTKPFGLSADTYALCIPTNTDASDDDILNYIEELFNATRYFIDAYDVDDETYIADLIVRKTAMISGTAGSVTSYRNFSGLVTKAVQVYNPETDATDIKISIIAKGNEKAVSEQTFVVSPLIADYDKFKTISKGDFISFSLDGFDRMNGFEMQQELDKWYDRTDPSGSVNSFIGTVDDITFNQISNSKARWMDALTVSNMNGVKQYELMHNASLKPVVYIMDSKGNAKLGSVSDIRYNDTIYVFAESVDVYAIILYR
ncbi:MAG: S-layer homology domain-containing protein [Clostridia bacterium]|nr:S-layer homology domain-containing protein [Clostridia bacterium]